MQIDKEWEKFSGGPFVPYSERIYVTINGRGKLCMNRKTYSMIGKPQRILLYFNREKGQIGVRPAHDRLAEAFPVRQCGGSYIFHVGTFMRHFGIKLKTTERFVGADVNNQGLLALDLSNTTTVGGFTRKKRRT